MTVLSNVQPAKACQRLALRYRRFDSLIANPLYLFSAPHPLFLYKPYTAPLYLVAIQAPVLLWLLACKGQQQSLDQLAYFPRVRRLGSAYGFPN